MIGCGATVEVSISRGYTSRLIDRTCGRQYGGETLLCDACETRAQQAYPQGYRYVPGDCCSHGTYVGGSGVDLMCHWCELGS